MTEPPQQTVTSGSDRGDGVDRARWDTAHAVSISPAFSRIKRETMCANLPEGVEPTTLWPSWPLAEIAAQLELRPAETLVDLACGRGEVGLWIAGYLDAAWVGVEPSSVGLSAAAQQASKREDANGQRLTRVVEGHFLATGLASDTADAVLIVDALHFSPDVAATFDEVRRVLRRGRRLVIVGPQITDFRPALLASGFTIERDEQTPQWQARLGAFLDRCRAQAAVLRAEMGEVVAAQILSRDVGQLRDTGHGLIAARAPLV